MHPVHARRRLPESPVAPATSVKRASGYSDANAAGGKPTAAKPEHESKAPAKPGAKAAADDGKKEDRVFFSKVGSDAYSARPDDPGAAKIDSTKLDDALTSIDEFTK